MSKNKNTDKAKLVRKQIKYNISIVFNSRVT